jgi:proteic killer suppression protein
LIRSFKDKETEKVWRQIFSKKFPPDIQQRSLRKLIMLNISRSLEDLKIPPSNQLEMMKGDRKKEYSIRINKQWRICFEWESGHAFNVQITDYH